jgi:hypothetical protein
MARLGNNSIYIGPGLEVPVTFQIQSDVPVQVLSSALLDTVQSVQRSAGI